jgi:hypothetical protein
MTTTDFMTACGVVFVGVLLKRIAQGLRELWDDRRARQEAAKEKEKPVTRRSTTVSGLPFPVNYQPLGGEGSQLRRAQAAPVSPPPPPKPKKQPPSLELPDRFNE